MPAEKQKRKVRNYLKFKKQHKDSLADQLDLGRSRMANQTVMNKHFKLLGDLLEALDLTNKPERIFNCDESGIALDKQMSKVCKNC